MCPTENDLLDGRAPTLGRITGSSSIETLVRVGLEKENHGIGSETKMIVLHDFAPCVDDELEVKRGQIVNVLYQENDWVYVIAENNNNAEGFIPFSYCTPLSSPLAELVKHKKLPRTANNNLANSNKNPMDTGQVELQDTDTYSSIATSDIHPFFKDPSGKYVVLYTFIARDENDVSVERGEFVTVLNKDDHDWYWIIRSDGHEGFVPSAFVCPLEVAFGEDLYSYSYCHPAFSSLFPTINLSIISFIFILRHANPLSSLLTHSFKIICTFSDYENNFFLHAI